MAKKKESVGKKKGNPQRKQTPPKKNEPEREVCEGGRRARRRCEGAERAECWACWRGVCECRGRRRGVRECRTRRGSSQKEAMDLEAAKIELELNKSSSGLDHVDKPKDDPSFGNKTTFVSDERR